MRNKSPDVNFFRNCSYATDGVIKLLASLGRIPEDDLQRQWNRLDNFNRGISEGNTRFGHPIIRATFHPGILM